MRTIPDKACLQRGFSLLEMIIAVAILTAVLGAVFGYINGVQKTYRTEETKVDTTSEAREFIDQISRDLHQAGFPNANMFDPATVANPAANDAKVAVGLVKVTSSELWFEGDMDANGQVDSVHYTLMDNAGNPATGASSCPCSLQRSVVQKANGAPGAQLTSYNSGIDGVLNSGNMNAGAPLPIAGSTDTGGGALVANDVLYAAYKTPAVFVALDQTGTPLNPVVLANVRSIQITVNLLGKNADMQTHMPPVIPVTSIAKLNNY